MHSTFKELMQDWPRRTYDTRIILIRHGQSTFNVEGRHQGSSDDSVLTEVGQSMARQTGAFLSGTHIDALYTSPLKRARETASQMLSVMSPSKVLNNIHILSQLREIDLPTWQGLTHQYVQCKFNDDYHCWKQRPHEFCMTTPDGTRFPVLDLYERARRFWQTVLPRHRGQTLIVVGHAGTNRALISTALGIKPASYHTLQQSNCGISVLRFPGGYISNAQLEALNWIGHLGERIPQPKAGEQGLRLLCIPTPMTSDQMQRVTHLLEEVAIQFSLCGSSQDASTITEQILQNHSETLHLQVWREDFPERWQQAIATRSTLNGIEKSLMTGLVVADGGMLQRLAGHVLGLPTYQSDRLQLHPGTVSVLHYAASPIMPMLQVINLDASKVATNAVPLIPALAASPRTH
jgi:probable phosphoglycerate mutase